MAERKVFAEQVEYAVFRSNFEGFCHAISLSADLVLNIFNNPAVLAPFLHRNVSGAGGRAGELCMGGVESAPMSADSLLLPLPLGGVKV